MSVVLSVVGLAALAVGVVGTVKGSVSPLGLTNRRACALLTTAAVAVLAAGGSRHAAPAEQPTYAGPRAAATADATAAPTPPPAAAPPAPAPPASEETAIMRAAAAPLGPLLLLAPGGDGDSWRDTRGVEYRMGLINAPEYDECGGATATAYRKRRLADGFFARSYSTDRYGRRVSVIFTSGGANLNVEMARQGIANDRYLAQFRAENPALARQVDAAFAEAKAARRGVWGSCSASVAPRAVQPPAAAPATGGCHPDYLTCIPVKGDGSGVGSGNDLDCGDLRRVVQLRVPGRDPYRLDADGDGVGCESYG